MIAAPSLATFSEPGAERQDAAVRAHLSAQEDCERVLRQRNGGLVLSQRERDYIVAARALGIRGAYPGAGWTPAPETG